METNIVYNRDCMEVMKELPDKSVQLIATDPPYEFISKSPVGGGFMDKENKRHLHKINDTFGMTYDPIQFLNASKRLMDKFNGYFFTNKSLLTKYIQFAEENNYKWDILLYSKPNPVPINNGHYLIDKEYIVFIKEKGATFNSNLGYQSYFTIKSYPLGNNKNVHPTQKPLDLIKGLISVSSNKGDVIFDGYLGSGTTAIASIQLDRQYIGAEIDQNYYKLAMERIKHCQLTLL